MEDPATASKDPLRQRLIRSVFEPSSLPEVAEAVAVAAAEEHNVYVERTRGRYRWSLCTGAGPYPLTRITAHFLQVDYRSILIGFHTVGDGWCILVKDPAARVEPDAWAVLSGPELAGSKCLAASIESALDASPNMWPRQMPR